MEGVKQAQIDQQLLTSVLPVTLYLSRALPGVEGVIQGQIDQQLDSLRQDLKAQVNIQYCRTVMVNLKIRLPFVTYLVTLMLQM